MLLVLESFFLFVVHLLLVCITRSVLRFLPRETSKFEKTFYQDAQQLRVILLLLYNNSLFVLLETCSWNCRV